MCMTLGGLTWKSKGCALITHYLHQFHTIPWPLHITGLWRWGMIEGESTDQSNHLFVGLSFCACAITIIIYLHMHGKIGCIHFLHNCTCTVKLVGIPAYISNCNRWYFCPDSLYERTAIWWTKVLRDTQVNMVYMIKQSLPACRVHPCIYCMLAGSILAYIACNTQLIYWLFLTELLQLSSGKTTAIFYE